MRVANEVYKEIKMDWDNITFPLKEGSPVSLDGVVSNDGDAIGLVPQTITKEPLIKSIWILVGGDVDLAEVEEAFGDSLEDAAKSNMNGLRFWLDDGTVYNAKELPSVTADDNGDVLTVVEGAWAKATPSGGGGTFVVHGEYNDVTSKVTLDKTWKEIHDALVDGKIPILAPDSESDYTTIGYIYATTMNSLESYAVYGFVIDAGSLVTFEYETNSEDGYPTAAEE